MPSKPIRRLLIVAAVVILLWTKALAWMLVYTGWVLARWF